MTGGSRSPVGGSLKTIAWPPLQTCHHLDGAGFSDTQIARFIESLRFAEKYQKKASKDRGCVAVRSCEDEGQIAGEIPGT